MLGDETGDQARGFYFFDKVAQILGTKQVGLTRTGCLLNGGKPALEYFGAR